MTITDYETGRQLRDIGLSLTTEEAQELKEYLTRLLSDTAVTHVYLTEISPKGLEKEIAISIEGERAETRPKKLPLPRTRNLSVA